MYGRIQFMSGFAVNKVNVVNCFPGLRVQMVDSLPEALHVGVSERV